MTQEKTNEFYEDFEKKKFIQKYLIVVAFDILPRYGCWDNGNIVFFTYT